MMHLHSGSLVLLGSLRPGLVGLVGGHRLRRYWVAALAVLKPLKEH